MQHASLKQLTFSALMIALATVLSLVKIWSMPLGGSVTLVSMLPLCVLALTFGTSKAVLPCFLYGVIQLFLDLGTLAGWGLTWQVFLGSACLDYLLPFTALCVAGAFRRAPTGPVGGVCLAMVLRFLCHFTSGCIFFRTFERFNNFYLWSLVYNGTFMGPELVLTVASVLVLQRTGLLERLRQKWGNV